MSKELEAYRRLCIHLNYKDDYLFNGSFNEDDEIIETALKDYEKSKKVKSYKKLKEIYSTLKKDRDLYLVFEKQYGREDCYYKRFSQLSSNNQKSKELKALEIIKEKRVDVSWLIKCFGFIENSTNEEECEYYNNNYEAYRNSKPLTQEEYDLLKEVLL